MLSLLDFIENTIMLKSVLEPKNITITLIGKEVILESKIKSIFLYINYYNKKIKLLF